MHVSTLGNTFRVCHKHSITIKRTARALEKITWKMKFSKNVFNIRYKIAIKYNFFGAQFVHLRNVRPNSKKKKIHSRNWIRCLNAKLLYSIAVL